MVKQGGIQQELSGKGTLKRYRATAIGEDGLKNFLLYEFAAGILCPLPGKFGIYARQLFMPLLFKTFGSNIMMHSDVVFRRPSQICLGNGVILEEGVTLDVKSDTGFIDIQDDVHIGKNTIISCPGGTIQIGNGTHIGRNCRLGSLKGLTIGNQVKIDDMSCVVGAGHAYSAHDLPIIHQPLTCKGPTRIEDNVRIEKNVTVLDGAHIGANANILNNSLVIHDITANCTAGGIPAAPC